MEIRETTHGHFEHLRNLNEKLLLMSYETEMAVAISTTAFLERRHSLAERVISDHDRITQYAVEINNLSISFLQLHDAKSSDLRFVATTIKIVNDMERIAGNGIGIANCALEVITETELMPIVDLRVMARAAQEGLKNSVNAFVYKDVDLAQRVINNEGYIDDVYEQMLRELLTYMLEDPSTKKRALRLVLVAKNLERAGDHAVNIAEMVVSSARGRRLINS